MLRACISGVTSWSYKLNHNTSYLATRHSVTSNNQTRNTRNTGSTLIVIQLFSFGYCKWLGTHLVACQWRVYVILYLNELHPNFDITKNRVRPLLFTIAVITKSISNDIIRFSPFCSDENMTFSSILIISSECNKGRWSLR